MVTFEANTRSKCPDWTFHTSLDSLSYSAGHLNLSLSEISDRLSGGGVDSLTCEPDDDLVLMADLRESTNLVSKASSNCFVRFLLGKQADTVKGSDMVKFIEDTRKVTPEEAMKQAERLFEKGLLTSTSPNLKEFDTQTNYYLPDGIRRCGY